MNRNCLFNKAVALLLCAVLLIGYLPSIALPAAAATNDWEGEIDIVETTTGPAGAQDNPITLTELENSLEIAAGATVYYSCYARFNGSTMTVTGDTGFLVDVGEGPTEDTDGTFIYAGVTADRFTPFVFAITNSTENAVTYQVNFTFPAGSAQNPEDIGLDWDYTATLEAGNEEGYYYTYTAAYDGVLQIIVSNETGWQYNITNNSTSANDVQTSADGSAYTYESTVSAGDEISIIVNTYDSENPYTAPAGSVTVRVQYKPGTEVNPILLTSLVNNVNVPAGETVYYHGNFSGMLMTVTGTGNYIYGGAPAEIDGVAISVDSGSMWSRDIVVAIQNTGAEAADYTISFAYPLGVKDNPATAVLGDNAATVKEGTDGYFFTYTAEKTGTLVMTMPAGNWQYTVNNLTTGVIGDLQDSSLDPVPNPYELAVTAGDEIEIIVNTFNPEDVWTAPAGSVSFNLAYKPEGPIVDENLKFIQTGLSFQEYIGMQSLITKAVVDGYDSFRVEAVQATPDGDVVETLVGSELYGYYYVYDKQILSWSMTEEVTITIYAEKDGVQYQSVPVVTTVKAMAMDRIATYYSANNLNACKALVDMLNYGTEVQKAFNYNATNLPNADLGSYSELGTSETPTFNATNSTSGTGTISVLQNSVSLQSKVEVQMLFSGDVSNYEIRSTVGGVTTTIPASEFLDYYGYKIARVAVKAANMREIHTIALYDPATGEPVTQVYTVSVEAYAQTMLGGTYNDVVIAMMKYGDSVAALG